jgi:hypothetical protein
MSDRRYLRAPQRVLTAPSQLFLLLCLSSGYGDEGLVIAIANVMTTIQIGRQSEGVLHSRLDEPKIVQSIAEDDCSAANDMYPLESQ